MRKIPRNKDVDIMTEILARDVMIHLFTI